MTLTGHQIRDARALIGLRRWEVAVRSAFLTTAIVKRAEAVDDEPTITTAQATTIRQVLEKAGIEFTANPPRARLRTADPA